MMSIEILTELNINLIVTKMNWILNFKIVEPNDLFAAEA